MARQEQKITVQFFGETHTIRGHSSEEHIRSVAKDVDKRLTEVSLKYPRLPMHQIALLVALNLADELAVLREEYRTLLELLDE